MMILSTYRIPHRKSNPMSPFSLPCEEFLFLAVSIFRHTIFGMVLLVVPDIFGLFQFLGRTAIFSMSILAGLYIAGMVAMQGDMWQVQILTFGSLRV
jgi:hypothetical protein